MTLKHDKSSILTACEPDGLATVAHHRDLLLKR